MISKETAELCLALFGQVLISPADPEGEEKWVKAVKAVKELRAASDSRDSEPSVEGT